MAQLMIRQGYTRVYALVGGLREWLAHSYPHIHGMNDEAAA